MRILAVFAVCITAGAGSVASAQPPSDAQRDYEAPPQPSAAVAENEPNPEQSALSDSEQALDLSQLSDLRGGDAAGIQVTNQNLSAINAGNSVSAGDSVGSGAVNVNAGAFTGYDGIGNFVINTGHNNNLIGSISVNVMVTPQ